jgi:uncharacterized Ntn-hydrolase superfamily protein
MTFSIVARSAEGDRWGVAVASKFLAAGAVVPGVRAPLGAIATQSFANLRYLPDGFALLADGRSAPQALDALIAGDDGRDQRQSGIVDGQGGAATFTGGDCMPWASGVTGPGYAIQGNILTGPEVIAAMEAAFIASDTADPLAHRLHAALLAGDRAGGDSRGRQSAAILVGGVGAGYGGGSDIAVDLRVDDTTIRSSSSEGSSASMTCSSASPPSRGHSRRRPPTGYDRLSTRWATTIRTWSGRSSAPQASRTSRSGSCPGRWIPSYSPT